MRVRRVAGIIAFALALALGLMLMFQATDPAAAAPPPQTPEAGAVTHETKSVLLEPEADGNTVGYRHPDFEEYTGGNALGAVDQNAFDAFGVAYTITELTRTGTELTIGITPCPQTWEIETLTLGPPDLGTGRTTDVVIGDSADESSQLTLEASSCQNPRVWIVTGVPTDAITVGNGKIATRFRVRSTTTQENRIVDDIGGPRGAGLKGTICALPSLVLGEGSCAPLMIFTPPLAVVGSMFGVAGVRNPLILAGAGLVSMSAMAAIVMPAPVMILGFVVASVGTTATLLLLRR